MVEDCAVTGHTRSPGGKQQVHPPAAACGHDAEGSPESLPCYARGGRTMEARPELGVPVCRVTAEADFVPQQVSFAGAEGVRPCTQAGPENLGLCILLGAGGQQKCPPHADEGPAKPQLRGCLTS